MLSRRRDIAVLLVIGLGWGCLGWEPIEANPTPPPPNQPPRIVAVDPSETVVTVRVDQAQAFTVKQVFDPDSQLHVFGYRWELDGIYRGNSKSYLLQGVGPGVYVLQVTVWDCNDVRTLDDCIVTTPQDITTASHSWKVSVQP